MNWKKVDIKNGTCYYFDDIIIYYMKVADIDFDNILLDEKLYKTYKNILIYDISYKTFMGAKQLRIRSDEIDGFIQVYDGTRYLVFFGSGWYDAIGNRMNEKSGITYSINHNCGRIRIASYNSLPI